MPPVMSNGQTGFYGTKPLCSWLPRTIAGNLWPAPGLHPKTPPPASSWVPASSAHTWPVSCKPYKQPGSPGSTIPASGEQLMVNRCGCILLGLSLLASPIPALEEDPGWINLIGDHELAAWRKPTGT